MNKGPEDRTNLTETARSRLRSTLSGEYELYDFAVQRLESQLRTTLEDDGGDWQPSGA